MKMQHRMRTGLIAGLLAAVTLAGCSSGSSSDTKAGAVAKPGEKVTLRLGYLANITHAPALVGLQKGIFADKLGPDVTLQPSVFNAGPAEVEALFSGAIDATYLGPNPAINAYAQSKGQAVRIISGATSGGAFLVVNPSIKSAADLKGKKVSSPQLGNTQDVALRSWLQSQGLKTDTQGGGDVSVVPQDNATALAAFESGAIAGAWEPEPWATRMVQEGKGKILVDERTLWPAGQFVTTELMVRTAFLNEHPDVVQGLLAGQVAATDFINANPTEAETLANQALQQATGKAISQPVLDASWPHMTFTDDPLASSLRTGAAHAEAVGLLDPKTNLDGLFDLALLNKVLKADGKPPVHP
jgi:NitT/TauT family transport system substrate-binding protein